MIFVFGSNLSGIHGGGAARHAHLNLGAEWGVGEGPTGECYALPTKDERLLVRSLEDIAMSIKKFYNYATLHEDREYQVTRVGCGLAGYSDSEIAPLFSEYDWHSGVLFPAEWAPWVGPSWGSYD